MISVSVLSAFWSDPLNSSARCGDPGFKDATTIAAALDWVRNDLVNHGATWQAGIVNISLNGVDFGPSGTLRSKMQVLASPYVGAGVYMGAFVVQAAGNQQQDACQYAYGDPSPNDGIMVIGGVTSTGAAAWDTANGGFNNNQPYAGNEPGSNFGRCVEAWAPSQKIWMPWGPAPGNQIDGITYNNYGAVSGTSFAAPHVTAIAAHIMMTQGIVSSTALETAVRNTLYTTGQTDGAGYTIYYPRIP
jgi:subtilisin family serine protease